MINFREFDYTETSFMLFAINKTLRDRQGLTSGMEDFYERTSRILREKLLRLDVEYDR